MLVLSRIKAEYYGIEIPELNLSFNDGVTLVLGEVGAYKTTILKVIGGIKEIIDGEITLNGKRIEELPPKERSVALVSRDTIPSGRVLKALMQPLRLRKVGKREARSICEAKISEKLDRSAKIKDLDKSELTDFFGMRLSLRQTEVTMFDEPYHFLGEDNEAVTRIIRSRGGIVIVTSCDGGDIRRLEPENLIIIRKGVTLYSGKTEDLRAIDNYIRLITQ